MFGTLIGSVTVGAGGAANITFSSIPATYTDLTVVYSLRSNNADIPDQVLLTFNGSGAGYNLRAFNGNGSTVTATSAASSIFINTLQGAVGANATASTFGNGQISVPNYAGSTNKTVSADSVSENNATQAWQAVVAGSWTNTAAITSLTLAPGAGTLWAQYSTAYLYGVTKGTGGATAA